MAHCYLRTLSIIQFLICILLVCPFAPENTLVIYCASKILNSLLVCRSTKKKGWEPPLMLLLLLLGSSSGFSVLAEIVYTHNPLAL